MRKTTLVIACVWAAAASAAGITIDDAIAHALGNSPAAAAADATYLTARADLWQGWANILPSASVSYAASRYYDRDSYSIGGTPIPGYTPSTRSYYASAALTQPLFAGGSLIYGVMSGRASSRAGNAGRREQRDRLVVDVAKSYFAVLKTDGLKAVADTNLAATVQAEELARARYDTEEISRREYLKTKVLKGQAETAAIAATAAAATARIGFFNVVGMVPEEDLAFADVPPQPRRELGPLPELIDRAMTVRPDVVKTREEKRRADLAVKSADAGWFPVIAASASYDYSGADAPAEDNCDDNTDWTVGISASWDILNRFGTIANHKRARAAALTADAAYDRIRDAVALDVTGAFYEYVRLAETINVAEETAEASAEEYASVQELYAMGGASALELSDAQARFVEAQNSSVEARYNFLTADYELRRALGELSR